MNDLRSRLEGLADDATANVELRNPRLVRTRRQSWRTWLAGILAVLLAGVASLAGGNVILNTGDRSDVSTVEGPQSTTDPDLPPDDDKVSTTPSSGPGPEVPPTSATTPTGPTEPSPSGSPPAGSDDTATPRANTVADRYGELGPLVAVAPNDGSTGTAGSGCQPGSPDRLPDGVWMTYVTAFSTGTLAVDVVCYETDESTVDGDVLEDWEVTNDNTQTRTVPLAADARFFLQTDPAPHFPGEPTETRSFDDPTAAAEFAAQSGDATPLAWVLVEGGVVTEVYSPPLGSS